MIDKKFTKDIFHVLLSNGVKLLLSIGSILVIPLIFSKQDYGFYKLFLLYMSYIGFFGLGFIDGIYLHYAGWEYEDLPKEKFVTFTKTLILIQILISISFLVFGLFQVGDRKYILILSSINSITLVLTGYYQIISQITKRFKEFAIVNITFSILTVLLIAIFYLFKIDNYIYFLIFTIFINIVILLSYAIMYRNISIGYKIQINKFKEDIKKMFIMGIPLLLSNIVLILHSNIPRQLIEIKFPIEKFPEIFSDFSFAFTLIGFTSVFLTAFSVVFYPRLKASSDVEISNTYINFDKIIIVIVSISLAAFFPLKIIINYLLPEYNNSVLLFFILCPSIMFTSSVSVIKHNYYKKLNLSSRFLFIGIFFLIILIGLFGYMVFFVTDSLIILTSIVVAVQLLWYIFLEFDIQRKLKIRSFKTTLYVLLSSLFFYLSYYFKLNIFSFLFYIVSLFLLITFVFRNEIFIMLKKIKKGDKRFD